MRKQLSLLGYKDEELVYYRGFYPKSDPRHKDDAGRKAKANASIENPNELVRWQEDGRGIYFVVNGQGDKDSQVIECRAIFYEHDHLDIDLQLSLWQTLGLPCPTFQLNTGGKSIHSYWVFDKKISVKDWKLLQSDLLDFADADRSIKNPSRVMRLEGFMHPEGKEESSVINETSTTYNFDTLRELIPKKAAIQPARQNTPINGLFPLTLGLAIGNRALVEHGAGEGSRNQKGYILACDLIGTERWMNLSGYQYDYSADSLFNQYCDRCNPPIDDGERKTIWRSAEKNGAKPSLSADKLINCIQAWERSQKATTTVEPKKKITSKTKKPLPDADEPEKDEDPEKQDKEPNCVRLDRILRDLGHRFAFNELTEEIEIDGQKVEDMDVLWAGLSIEHNRNLNPKTSFLPVLKRISLESSYHPVRQYLNIVSQKFQEKSPYLLTDEVLSYGLGLNPANFEPERWKLYQKFISRWLIGSVARVYEPGCKMDTALVLQGNQGSGKSQFFQILGGDFHVDSIGDLKNKDAYMKAATSWIVEWGELESIVGHKAASAVREFLTSREDIYRKPYSAGVTRKPRTYVVAGTTNSSNYLHDDTGTGSRRFLTIGWITKANDVWLKLNRDRIWAAAVAEYRDGTRYWFEDIEIDAINERNKEAEAVDPINSLVAEWLRRYPQEFITTTDVMTGLKFETKDLSKALEMRIAIVLKELGYTKRAKKVHGRTVNVWKVDTSLGANQVSTQVSTASNPYDSPIPVEGLAPLTPKPFSFNKEEEEIEGARGIGGIGEIQEKKIKGFENQVPTANGANPIEETYTQQWIEVVDTP